MMEVATVAGQKASNRRHSDLGGRVAAACKLSVDSRIIVIGAVGSSLSPTGLRSATVESRMSF